MSCLDPVQLPCANLQRHRELSGHPAVCSMGAPSEPKHAEAGAAEEQGLLHQPLLSFNVSFCLCSACFPPLRCRSLPTPAVVTVTPVQHTAPPTCRCSLLVPELRSLPFSCHLPLPTALGCPSCHRPPRFPPVPPAVLPCPASPPFSLPARSRPCTAGSDGPRGQTAQSLPADAERQLSATRVALLVVVTFL